MLDVWLLDPAQITPYYNRALGEALAAAGCTVRYITTPCLYDPGLPPPRHVTQDHHYFRVLNHRALLRLPALRRALRAASYPLGHARLLARLRHHRPDIVHLQWSRLPRLDLPFIRALKRAGLPVVHTIHDTNPLYAYDSEASPLGAVYAAADALILHAEANRADFLTRYPAVLPEKTHIIPHISIHNHAIPPDASRAAARKRLGLPAEAPVIGFFGSVKRYKGLDVLVEAFARVRAARPDAWLLVAGQPDGPASAGLLRGITAAPNTLVRDSFVPYDEVWQYHLAADVLAFPYRYVTQSGALITALDFARPAVVTRVGGMPELVEGGGWAVPPEDVSALADALLEALAHPALDALGLRARANMQAICAPEIVAGATLDLYLLLLDRERSLQDARRDDA
ncbi:MAG: glycosyltransferase [Anaerolineae bacterium]|nr:glycosyltransferase [Anaerolineae bacterium]